MTNTQDRSNDTVGAATAVAVIMIGQQLAGKALRDAFFLSNFEASRLPTVMMTASILSVVIVLGTTRLFRRVTPSQLVPWFFGASAALFVAEWALSQATPRIAATLLYVHITSFGAVAVSGFWSVINERFDPHTAKQVIGRIAGGATLGGVLGGLAAWQGASLVSIPTMILILGLLNGICAFGVVWIGGAPQKKEKVAAEVSALTILEETPYLRHLALLVALSALGAAACDYVFKARAVAHFATGEQLVSFFALFYLCLGLATFFLQSLLAKRALQMLGLTVTVGMLPGTVAILGLAAIMFPGVWTAVALRGGAGVVESSLYRSGYELLYTPLTPKKKRPTKTLIDVGADKLGAAAGGALALFILGLVPDAANAVLLGIAVASSVAALVVTGVLHRGYISSLADNLRSGSINAGQLEAVDATTLRTIDQTLATLDRSMLPENLQELEPQKAFLQRPSWRSPSRPARRESLRVQQQRHGTRADTKQPSTAESPKPFEVTEVDQTVMAILDFQSEDTTRIERALRLYNPLPGPLVGHVIPLLKRDDLVEPVTSALRKVAPVHTGLLLDTLISKRTDMSIRRRIPGVLQAVPTQRSADGLIIALGDDRFEVRYRAASALSRIAEKGAKLRVPSEPIFKAAEQEAVLGGRMWKRPRPLENATALGPSAVSANEARVSQILAYVFALLSTVLDREPLRLALRALSVEHDGRRGTGLEYLENVLPPGLKTALWPLLEDRRVVLAVNQGEAGSLDDLLKTTEDQEIDLEALRERIQAKRKGRATQQREDLH